MLPQFTRYLLQFQQVHVPSVGTIRLVQQPASLDVANKLIHPPSFVFDFSEDGWLTKHQLWHFGTQLHYDEMATRDSLQDVGMQIRKAIEAGHFTWNGVGTFTYTNHKIRFSPQQHAQLLKPVAAERVIREGAQHSVLVGDTRVLSHERMEIQEAEERHWNWSRILGWAAVILSLFFILFYLYQQQFNATASGLHEKINAQPPAATYQQ